MSHDMLVVFVITLCWDPLLNAQFQPGNRRKRPLCVIRRPTIFQIWPYYTWTILLTCWVPSYKVRAYGHYEHLKCRRPAKAKAPYQGPVSLTDFWPKFKFDGKFALLKFCYWPSDRSKFLHMPRQHSCRAMYKIWQRSLYQNRVENESKFPSNLNCDGKTVSETGPWAE